MFAPAKEPTREGNSFYSNNTPGPNVVKNECLYAECHYAECCGAVYSDILNLVLNVDDSAAGSFLRRRFRTKLDSGVLKRE